MDNIILLRRVVFIYDISESCPKLSHVNKIFKCQTNDYKSLHSPTLSLPVVSQPQPPHPFSSILSTFSSLSSINNLLSPYHPFNPFGSFSPYHPFTNLEKKERRRMKGEEAGLELAFGIESSFRPQLRQPSLLDLHHLWLSSPHQWHPRARLLLTSSNEVSLPIICISFFFSENLFFQFLFFFFFARMTIGCMRS